MSDLLRVLLDSIAYLWPLRIVSQWERAGYYVGGRYWRALGPGCYPVVPWFTTVHTVSAVPAIVGTPRQDITLADGRTTLSFSATATVRVTDLDLALNGVDNFTETTQELIGAVLADRLAQVDAERLAPEKRGRLMADLTRWVAAEAAAFGVEVTKLRFTNVVLNVRTVRLLQDGGAPAPW